MDSVTLWELEHGEELRLGRASQAVVGERGQDGGVGAPGHIIIIIIIVIIIIYDLLLLSPGLVH